MDSTIYVLIGTLILLFAGIFAAKAVKSKYGVNTDAVVNIMQAAEVEVASELKDRISKNQTANTELRTNGIVGTANNNNTNNSNILKMPAPGANKGDKNSGIKEDGKNEDDDSHSDAALRE